LFLSKICSILFNIGNENKADVSVATLQDSLLSESEVVFMVNFLLFLIIGLMTSTTVNVALLTVIYILWTNKE